MLELRLVSLIYWSMQVSLKNSPKTSIENHPNYRGVQVSNQQGRVGMLLPHANLVVPDKKAIRELREIIQLYEQLKPSESFNSGTSSTYRKQVWENHRPNTPEKFGEPSVYDLPFLRNSKAWAEIDDLGDLSENEWTHIEETTYPNFLTFSFYRKSLLQGTRHNHGVSITKLSAALHPPQLLTVEHARTCQKCFPSVKGDGIVNVVLLPALYIVAPVKLALSATRNS